jgi:CRISPR/Cas system CSM-associated protein Csm3 (group 7 of RAMP superfamily)
MIFRYKLTFEAAVSVFSGLAVAGLVDRMVVRDHRYLPVIPGSSVKGRWRFFAERSLRTIKAKNKLSGLWVHPEKGPLCKDREDACTVCRLFGSSTMPSLLWVGQAELDEALKQSFLSLLSMNSNPACHTDTEIRPGIAISRKFRTALKDHLFFDEAVSSGAIFFGEAKLVGIVSDEEQKFLKCSGTLVDRIGGRKAVGRGLLKKGIEIESEGGQE